MRLADKFRQKWLVSFNQCVCVGVLYYESSVGRTLLVGIFPIFLRLLGEQISIYLTVVKEF